MWDLERYSSNTAVIDDKGNNLSYGDLLSYERELCSRVESRSLVMLFARNTLGAFMVDNIPKN
ncbi:hypothetical protein SAMN02745213_01158 [Succinivibrio dextrinosolvens DSM 3072]|uniref:AMP-binding enzyme n=1 Tax=Succinivibrio dextrinosolvens DSM 3072 TaxID=1123324 RepID=A0A1T4VBI5_9GAMM|nr:hypothetical protein [Succinivibrio dextrinosolvens]SKA61861.1 hypothetical protein SAMN02745213_01158 [Succinivibrio dextrinosolvens DSM 3072]